MSSLLQLTYSRKNDKFILVTVIGDPYGIRDLYWQLTENYKPVDGTAIGEIKITNLEGIEINIKDLMTNPHTKATCLSNNL